MKQAGAVLTAKGYIAGPFDYTKDGKSRHKMTRRLWHLSPGKRRVKVRQIKETRQKPCKSNETQQC